MFDMENFTKIMNDLNEKHDRFARYIGISGSVLYNYCNGRTNPSAKSIKKICEKCGISANELLNVKNTGGADWGFSRTEFAQRFKFALYMRRKSQAELSRELNISTQTISNYVNEFTEPNGAIIADLCEYLDVSADWLLGLA